MENIIKALRLSLIVVFLFYWIFVTSGPLSVLIGLGFMILYLQKFTIEE